MKENENINNKCQYCEKQKGIQKHKGRFFSYNMPRTPNYILTASLVFLALGVGYWVAPDTKTEVRVVEVAREPELCRMTRGDFGIGEGEAAEQFLKERTEIIQICDYIAWYEKVFNPDITN